jgi:hypothetical protein
MKHPPVKDRRNVGRVVPFVEKFLAARELSSCCVGTEAALEADRPDLVRLAESLQDSV